MELMRLYASTPWEGPTDLRRYCCFKTIAQLWLLEDRLEHRTISKHQEAQKGWIIGRNGIAMPRSAYILAELLESQREELKLSKAAFSRKLGIPAPTLHNLLNGAANPTLDYVAALADKLGLVFKPKFTQPVRPLVDDVAVGSASDDTSRNS